jgi:DNA-binding NarL/FixJ family response regulator
MRVVLVGSPAARARLRAQLPSSVEVVGEHLTAADAAVSAVAADAVLTATEPASSPGARAAAAWAPDGGAVEHLTARELEVLAHLADGLANRAIADRLGISPETVKFHVASIMGKLGTSNRVETVRRAVRRGLVAI